jgi:hypothetical protein
VFAGQLSLHIFFVATVNTYKRIGDYPKPFIQFLFVWTFIVLILFLGYFMKNFIYPDKSQTDTSRFFTAVNMIGVVVTTFSVGANCILLYLHLLKDADNSLPKLLPWWNNVMIPITLIGFIIMFIFHKFGLHQIKQLEESTFINRHIVACIEWINGKKGDDASAENAKTAQGLSSQIMGRLDDVWKNGLAANKLYKRVFSIIWLLSFIGLLISGILAATWKDQVHNCIIGVVVCGVFFVLCLLLYVTKGYTAGIYSKSFDWYNSQGWVIKSKLGHITVKDGKIQSSSSNHANLKDKFIEINKNNEKLYIKIVESQPPETSPLESKESPRESKETTYYILPLNTGDAGVYRAFPTTTDLVELSNLEVLNGPSGSRLDITHRAKKYCFVKDVKNETWKKSTCHVISEPGKWFHVATSTTRQDFSKIHRTADFIYPQPIYFSFDLQDLSINPFAAPFAAV